MPNINKLKQYEFIATGATGVGATSGSTDSLSAANSDALITTFDTVNKTVSVAYSGTTVTLATKYLYTYDFATDGGAVGNITLKGPALPANFVITNAVFYVGTAITSAGSAQISWGTSSSATTNLLGAAVLGTNGTAGGHQGVPDAATVADWVKTTAESAPVMAITVAALTAGRATFVIEGFVQTTDTSS